MPSARVRVLLMLALSFTPAPSAFAQVDEPIGPFVVDARGTLARFGEDAAVATAIAVTPVNLPTRGLGFVAGAHWYPLRAGRVTFGFGGELLMARDSRTLPASGEGLPDGPTVSTRMTSLAPQLSLNFGRRNGWSYISGGLGFGGFTAERADLPVGDAEGRTRALNYGGGARWFTTRRIAVSIDLRFYSINAQLPAANRPAFPSVRVMVISGGIGIR
jgi:hypothetical protein